MNRAILSATHQYAQANGIAASGIDVVALRFPGGLNYTFGPSLLVRYRDRASVIFLDMRRTNGVNPNGRRFVFSMMHHRFRIAYPDLADAQLELWRYQNNLRRTLVCTTHSGEIYTYDELVADVVETHQIWESVKRGSGDQRRAAGGGFGPLFD